MVRCKPSTKQFLPEGGISGLVQRFSEIKDILDHWENSVGRGQKIPEATPRAPMHTYISLLRGVNVSGQRPVKMPELRALCESIGCSDVVTYIQSGNVLFRSGSKDPAAIAAEKNLR